jgi:MoaA/NifB/PqqE/SkfB family radical SAM enzyme
MNSPSQREELIEAPALKSNPVSAWVSLTGKCNLNCLHCPKRSGAFESRNLTDLPLQVFHKLEEEIFPFLKQCKVGGNNLGEQLLAKEWDYFVDRIGRYSFEPTLVTNGLLLTKERIKKLLEGGWSIDLSVEGSTQSTYQNIRGGNFEKFLSVVRECCQQKRSFQETKPKIRLCFTTFYDNIGELIPLIEIGARLGVDEVLVAHFIPMIENQRSQSLVYHKGLANSIFEEGRRRAKELGISIQLPPPFPIKRMGEEDSKEGTSTPWDKKRCNHPFTSVSINEKGDIIPCCISDEKMGNLMEASFEKIWKGKKYQKLRKTVNSSNPISFCRHCVLRGKDFTHVHCNDDRALLNFIGPTNQVDARFLMKLLVKREIGKYRWGKKLIQEGKAFYKKFEF